MSFRCLWTRRTLVVLFITLLIVFELTAYAITTPRPREEFFQFYILGANHMTSNYYPRNDDNIYISDRIALYIGVCDEMGTVQLVSIRVKIGNQTIGAPDDLRASRAPLVTEFTRFLQQNETWETPFVWTIANGTMRNGSINISMLRINNMTYQISDWSSKNGANFRLIFELWTWRTDTNAFEYGWSANGQHRVAWLQFWFNMTSDSIAPR